MPGGGAESDNAMLPFFVGGKPLTSLPSDLFIPPDALAILLDSFSGPLDLLLYLIRRQNIDILDIPIADITTQYIAYIAVMEEARLELAADYLLMAATLAEIKSKLLLPVPVMAGEEEEDPRMKLVRQLQRYEQFKFASIEIENLNRLERDNFIVMLEAPIQQSLTIQPMVELSSLVSAMVNLMNQQERVIPHQITKETLSVRERMAWVLMQLHEGKVVSLTSLIERKEGRMGLVVTLLAILELARQSLLYITQHDLFSPVYIEAYQDE